MALAATMPEFSQEKLNEIFDIAGDSEGPGWVVVGDKAIADEMRKSDEWEEVQPHHFKRIIKN